MYSKSSFLGHLFSLSNQTVNFVLCSPNTYLKNKDDWDELTRSGLPSREIKAAIGKGTDRVKRGTGTDTETPKPFDPVKKASRKP